MNIPIPVLSFFYNWNNKLDCNCFTTIRLHNPKKYFLGSIFIVQLNKADKGKVMVLDVKPFLIKDLTMWMARIDTGYNKDDCTELIKKMYKNSNINFDTYLMDFVLLIKQKD